MSKRFKYGAAIVAIFTAWASPGLSSETKTYSYDALGRLVTTGTNGTVNNAVTTSTSFDPAGNRTNYTVTGVGSPANATLSIGAASVTEGGVLTFTVTRSDVTTSAVSASYASASGTATSGSDFTAVSGTVSFAAGEISKTISVSTIDDTAVEAAETMTVTLSAPTNGATIATGSATGTINDNDTAGTPSLAISDASGIEAQTLVFTVTMSAASANTVTVNYATAIGTAGALDFTATSGTLTFSPGQTSKTISVVTRTDAKSEVDEFFYVNLTSPANATISDSQGQGTIFDDGLGGTGGCPTC